MTTLHDFRLAAIAHLAAAQRLLAQQEGVREAKTPATAAYLATVSLECVLKARLLFRGGFESVEMLRDKAKSLHDALFTGAKGHSVGTLALQLRLEQLLKSEGKALPNSVTWKRLSRSERPYSLRYGAEHLSIEDAAEEIAAVASLHGPLLAGLKLANKVPSKTKGTRKS